MNRLKYFLECCFHFNESFDYLDQLIKEFRKTESDLCQALFIKELQDFIHTGNYRAASQIIKKYGRRTFNLEKTEKFIKFLYDRLIDRPTDVKPEDFQKKFKGVFCPVCCPKPKIAIKFSLIEKATVISKDLQIYICKPCKLVWLTEDVRSDNAQDYKKFMRSLGLKGLWKELKDVDIL